MNIVVYGYYYKNNIGDQLFIEAFKELFPKYNFTFVNHLTEPALKNADAVFFGGGSLLFDTPNIDNLSLLKQKKIFYIGIGVEDEINPIHLELMSLSKLIVIRNEDKLDYISNLNKNVIYAPDIVYSLINNCVLNEIKPKSILFIPNAHLVPKNNDPLWKYNLWEYYKSEFSQFLDYLIENKYTIDMFPMCNSKHVNDTWAGIEIFNRMITYSRCNIVNVPDDFKNISSVFSKYESIISSRFHGIILANMVNRPCLTVKHHDKLNYGDNIIQLNQLNKSKLIKMFFDLKNKKCAYKEDTFKEMCDKVNNLLI